MTKPQSVVIQTVVEPLTLAPIQTVIVDVAHSPSTSYSRSVGPAARKIWRQVAKGGTWNERWEFDRPDTADGRSVTRIFFTRKDS